MAEASPLWHITGRLAWDEARRQEVYPWSTRGVTFAEEGFVHCCAPEQAPTVARAFYADVTEDLIVLEIDRQALGGVVVRVEEAPGTGERFPHLYDPLPLDAVVAVRSLQVLPDGAVRIGEPEQLSRG